MDLSIIVPVYNVEKYISLTLDSLLQINFIGDFEIIAVNDGSTDRSQSILYDYTKRDYRIKVISIDNNGVSNARNVGMAAAKGKYITFVDGDDTVDPLFFRFAVDQLENGNFDFVQGNYQIIDNGKTYCQQYQPENVIYTDRFSMLKGLLGENKKIHNAVWGKVYNKRCIEKSQFDTNIRIAEDQKFIFDVILNSERILISNVMAYNYVQRNTSAMHHNDYVKEMNDTLEVLSYYKNKVVDKELLGDIERQGIEILLNLYLSTSDDKIKQDIIYDKITKLHPELYWEHVDIKTKIKTIGILHLKKIFDAFYKRKISNENRSNMESNYKP